MGTQLLKGVVMVDRLKIDHDFLSHARKEMDNAHELLSGLSKEGDDTALGANVVIGAFRAFSEEADKRNGKYKSKLKDFTRMIETVLEQSTELDKKLEASLQKQ